MQAVILLTDGEANEGIADPELLKNTVERTLENGPPIKIHTFGYGIGHNETLLKKHCRDNEWQLLLHRK